MEGNPLGKKGYAHILNTPYRGHMENITLRVEGKPDVSFTGKLVANVDLSNAHDKLAVFETAKNHWFIARMDRYGYLRSHTLIENKDESKLIEHLKYTDDAKVLYRQMGVNYTQQLDI